MHSHSLPFRPFSRLFRLCVPVFAFLLLLCPSLAGADPVSAVPASEESAVVAPPPAVQEALQAVVEQTTPETPVEQPVQTGALPAVPGEANPASTQMNAEVPLQMAWLLDPKGTHTLGEVLSPGLQKDFTPYQPETLPHHAGTLWMRLVPDGKVPVFPLVLDLNTRIADQLPGTPQVWLARSGETAGTPVRPANDGLYPLPNPLPEHTDIYIRVNGIPAPGFVPLLRDAASLTIVDNLGSQPQLVLLAVLLFLCLLRGVAERREWRMWAALYIAAVWVQAFWGLPTTPAGEVSRWDMPGLLAPGVALLILPHVGRHMMRTRHHAPFIDMQFVLLALLGIVISVAPLVPGYTWTLQFLPLWPLFMLLLLPGTFAACLRRLPGAKRFFLICLLPPLGMLALFPLSRLLPDWLIAMLPHALDGFMTPGVVSLIPLTFLTLSALMAALSPSPKPLPAPNSRTSRETPKTGRAGVAALELGGFPNDPAPSGDRLPSLSIEPEGLAIAAFPTPKPAPARVQPEPTATAKPRKPDNLPYPQALQAPLSAGMVEESLRAPLDALLRAISAVDQSPLSAEARRRTDALGVAGRNLATAIGNMGKGAPAPDELRKERFDLNQLLLETHEAVANLAESKNLGLSWFTAPHLPRYYEGHRAQLADVLALLVESAVLATERGMVQIRAQRLPESTDPGHLLFTVSDTGCGMPPLGRSTLALVRAWELVGPDGELVSLESGPKGTTVSFSMRLAARVTEPQPVPAAEPDKDNLSRLPVSSLRIIVVSSLPANRQMLSFYLDELPHEIIEARSAEEAQTLYRRAPGALLIFDDDMPEEAIGSAVAAIRIFEGEHNFPLASILALVNSSEQIDSLRRAGCTHFLKKPITRKDLRHLTLRLAPVSRRFKDTDETPAAPKPNPKAPKQPAATSGPAKPKPVDLPDLPTPKAEQPAASAKTGLLGKLLSPFLKQKPAPERPAAPAVKPEEEPVVVLTEKAEKPKLSSVGEPMPIAKTDAALKETKRPSRPNPLEERAKHTPSRSTAPSNAAEWVGEPMPIITKPAPTERPEGPAARETPAMPTQEPSAVSPKPARTPAPEAEPVPAAGADEWVGEPMPITKPLSLEPEKPASTPQTEPANPVRSPLTLAMEPDEEPLTLTSQAEPAREETPLSLDEPLLLGEPLDGAPRVLDGDALLLDTPVAEAETEALSLDGLEVEKPSQPVITLTEPLRSPAEPAKVPAAEPPLPDLFGDVSPAVPESAARSLLDEAERLAPCEQGSRPAPASGGLHIEDIVELGEPVAPVEPERPAAPAPEAPQASRSVSPETNPSEEPQDEASDEAIHSLLADLDAALDRAIRGEQSGDAQAVCEAAAHIGRLAEAYDLRVLDDPARCLEEAACSGNMDEVAQLMPDLVAVINKNRASFEEQ